MHRFVIVKVSAMFAATLIIGAAVAGPDGLSQDPMTGLACVKRAKGLADYQDYASIAGLISTLPVWDEIQSLTDADWKKVVELADTLKDLKPDDMENGLLLYAMMVRFGQFLPPEDGVHDGADRVFMAQSRPLLLIRVMFDASCGAEEMAALAKEANDDGLFDGGGISASHSDDASGNRFSFPVGWQADHRPRLEAQRLPFGSTGSDPLDSYQPHREYRFYREHFKVRTDLQKAIAALEPKEKDKS